jgi:hypothetical protein
MHHKLEGGGKCGRGKEPCTAVIPRHSLFMMQLFPSSKGKKKKKQVKKFVLQQQIKCLKSNTLD